MGDIRKGSTTFSSTSTLKHVNKKQGSMGSLQPAARKRMLPKLMPSEMSLSRSTLQHRSKLPNSIERYHQQNRSNVASVDSFKVQQYIQAIDSKPS